MPRFLPLLLAASLALPAAPRDAAAQVRRCALPDGQTVYTDKRCDAIGGTERRAPPPGQPQLRSHRTACARTLRDLYFELGAAIESGDANRLAGVYHWPGLGTQQGYDVMRRLQAIVDRPLVDLQPIWPGGADDAYARGRAPVGFRVEQTSRNGSTPVRAVFGLRRHVGCWWVTLGGVARPSPPATAPDSAPADAPGEVVEQAGAAPPPLPAD